MQDQPRNPSGAGPQGEPDDGPEREPDRGSARGPEIGIELAATQPDRRPAREIELAATQPVLRLDLAATRPDDTRPPQRSGVLPDPTLPADQRVTLYGLEWSQYESLLVIRGERGVRMTYLDGALELMTPTVEHEKIKKCMARLIEAYAEEHGLDLDGHGAWPLRSEQGACGVEPDECYALGAGKSVPDLVVDVAWSEGGLDRLVAYQRLGIAEVWVWTREGIEVHRLRSGGYVQVGRSEIFAKLDLGLLARFVRPDAQTRTVRSFREALRGDGPSPQKPAATGPAARQP